jgi:hypothetical protein
LIYFCIPALNEERTVGVVLWKLRQVMTELQRDFQIIVVDDASTDATPQVLNPYARVLPLTLIRNEKQLGYAASMEIAIREAVRRSPYPKRDALVTLQADFTEDPDCVPALIKRIEAGADLVAVVPQLDDATPSRVRRGRRFFNWLLKAHEWAQVGDPFSGLRAYRVMTIKRAVEARGAARLMSWEGWAANAELLAQALPHSRRNDTIESPLHYRRLQRSSRFKFFGTLSQVLGVRSAKPSGAAPVSLPDTTIVVPAAIAVELATSHTREEARRRHPGPRREDPRKRRERTPRNGEEPRRRRENQPKRARGPRLETQVVENGEPPVVAAAPSPAPAREKRKRRSRKRRKPAQQPQDAAVQEQSAPDAVSPEASEPTPPVEGAKKKSRRGRRGGRGRRRAPRIDGAQAESSTAPQDNVSESTPQDYGS